MMSDASLLLAHPGQWLNAFALLIAFAAGWLLLATRLRELRLAPVAQIHPATGRINAFFYRFGLCALGLSLALSWVSTRLG